MSTDTNYVVLATLKRHLQIEDANDDDLLTVILAAACRRIDAYCDTRFYTTAADETRYETALTSTVLVPGLPVVSITSIAIDDDGDRTYATTLAAANYELYPPSGEAYTEVHVTPTGTYTFPTAARAVKIVGKFGYSSVPYAVQGAALILGARLWKRRDAPFGIAGATELGQLVAITSVDPDVKELLAPYVRVRMVAI